MYKEHAYDRQVKTEIWDSGADATGRAKKSVSTSAPYRYVFVTLYHIMKAQRERRSTPLRFSNLVASWCGWSAPSTSRIAPKIDETFYTGWSVGPWVGVEGCGKSCHHRSSNANRHHVLEFCSVLKTRKLSFDRLVLEYGTNRMPRNAGKHLPICFA